MPTIFSRRSTELSLERAPEVFSRTELKDILSWWARENPGVLALTGAAGCGKSVVASWFLESVLSTESADLVVSFSFHGGSTIEEFFAQLDTELTSFKSDEDQDRIDTLNKAGRTLILLDGLDVLQSPLSPNGRIPAQILNPDLALLVDQACEGSLPSTAILITTRIPLDDRLPHEWIKLGSLDAEVYSEALKRHFPLLARTPDLLLEIAAECGHSPAVLALLLSGESGAEPPALQLLSIHGLELARAAVKSLDLVEKHDPPAARLFELICLFHFPISLGILLALVANARVRQVLSLDLEDEEVRERLDFLAELSLVEEAIAPESRFQVNPVLRSGIREAQADRAISARLVIENYLDRAYMATPHQGFPSDFDRFEILEERLRQNLSLGQIQTALEIYDVKLGGYDNLGRRLGQYQRGQRICRAIAAHYGDWRTEAPDRVKDDWCLYLLNLGRLVEVESFLPQATEAKPDLEDLSLRARQCLTRLLIARGRLSQAEIVIQSLLNEEAHGNTEHDLECYALAGRLAELLGNTEDALTFSTRALAWRERDWPHPLYQWLGAAPAQVAARLQPDLEITRTYVEEIKGLLDWRWDPDNWESQTCNLILADLSGAEHSLKLVEVCEKWALHAGARELVCWAALVKGRVHLQIAERDRGGLNHAGSIKDAISAFTRGLELACQLGFSIHRIDLLLGRAKALLQIGDVEGATNNVNQASRAVESGRDGVPLYGLGHRACHYAWGEVEAKHLEAEILLLRAARTLGGTSLEDGAPGNTEVAALVRNARSELSACLRRRRALGAPYTARLEERLAEVSRGILTRLPLDPPSPVRQLKSHGGRYAFLSYSSLFKEMAVQIASFLEEKNWKVWLDRQKLTGGVPWQRSLSNTIDDSFAAIVLISSAELSPWQEEEVYLCMNRAATRNMEIIPVLLPTPETPPPAKLPGFLRSRHAIDLRTGITEETLKELDIALRSASQQ